MRAYHLACRDDIVLDVGPPIFDGDVLVILFRTDDGDFFCLAPSGSFGWVWIEHLRELEPISFSSESLKG